MIFIKNTIYTKVWKVDRQEKYTDLRISTSEKDNDGNYINSNWFARAIGHAHNQFKDINVEDRITITKAKLTNESYKDKEGNTRSSFKFLILEIESGDSKPKPDEKEKETTSSDDGVTGDGAMPW